MNRSLCLIILAAVGTLRSQAGEVLSAECAGLVAPDILAVHILDGVADYGRQQPYAAQSGDVIQEENFPHRWLRRDGEVIGAIAGGGKDILWTFDRVRRSSIDGAAWSQPGAYRLLGPSGAAIEPEAVYRKTRAHDMARTSLWEFDARRLHQVYLKFSRPLSEGAAYRLTFTHGELAPIDFEVDYATLRSEAVHVTQVGFRPGDPLKTAYLSCWMGDGGGVPYREEQPFHVIDAETGETVFAGAAQLSKAADAADEDAHQRNYNGTGVYQLDFSALTEPGLYRIVVDGAGCSRTFPVRDGVWGEAFVTNTRGLYHQRSGVRLGPPYTEFERPRAFHPDDGMTIYASTATLLETGNGPLAYETEPTNFGALVAGKTDEAVENAWGGYMDAGDWDRRTQHLVASQLLLELAAYFPDYFSQVNLNIPESGGPLPDIVDEALFGVDFFRRLQTPEGGVRGGIESEEHPRLGETSWQESLTVLAYAPGAWSSYYYAGVAARAARWLAEHGHAGRAAVYRESAIRAAEWAGDENQRKEAAGAFARPFPWGRSALAAGFAAALAGCLWLVRRTFRLRRLALRIPLAAGAAVALLLCLGGAIFAVAAPRYTVQDGMRQYIRDARNYAAAELYRLTGDERWHDDFLSTTQFTGEGVPLMQWRSHDQGDAAWVYIQTTQAGVDAGIQAHCREALLAEADERLAMTRNTGFGWAKHPYRPFGLGIPASPDAVTMLRAHRLTGNEAYLEGALSAAQFGAGANPQNLCLTTGVGADHAQHPLHLDSRLTGQSPPEGLTVLGPRDMSSKAFAGDWGRKLLEPHVYPSQETWPATDTYMDVFWNSPLCEYTIHEPMARNIFAWGYLAARGRR